MRPAPIQAVWRRPGRAGAPGRRHIEVKVAGQLVFDNAYQMLDAAVKGFGLAYLPQALTRPLVDAGELAWVLENWFPTFTGHHAYHPTRRQSSMAVRVVMAALRARPGGPLSVPRPGPSETAGRG